jgi:hypothetical protein
MLSDWSAECSADDPVLVVPWQDPTGPNRFIDLTANPYDLDAIPEAEQHPPLLQALRALNAPRSPVFTAKCDAWSLTPEDIAPLRLELDLASQDAAAGFASYIDLVWRERSTFTSFHRQEQAVQRLTRHVAAIDHPYAALDCVLRPALIDLDGPQEGFAVSLYVKALGLDAHAAWHAWAKALDAVVGLIRSRDLAPSPRPRVKAAPQNRHKH